LVLGSHSRPSHAWSKVRSSGEKHALRPREHPRRHRGR
jgi:hypothetical protein